MYEMRLRLAEQFMRLDSFLLRSLLRSHLNDSSFMKAHRGQGRILAILKMQPEIAQKELGYLLDMSRQVLAEYIGKLEKNGYITRARSEKDRRSCIIKLTDSGRQALPDEYGGPGDNGRPEELFDCLSDEELHSLSDYLARIIDAIKERMDYDDHDDYSEFLRERFFARHGLCDRDMLGFGHGSGVRSRFDGYPGYDRRDREDRHKPD